MSSTDAGQPTPTASQASDAPENGGIDGLNLVNAGYLLDLYDTYRADPAGVDAEWRAYFDAGRGGFEPVASVSPAAETVAVEV
ncbi:MAG TPA: hypothetical protein VIH24_07760, partial [Candidatus Limnocylindria bacterium]